MGGQEEGVGVLGGFAGVPADSTPEQTLLRQVERVRDLVRRRRARRSRSR